MSKKIYIGEVVSDKMNKTVVVSVNRLFQHSRYKKTIKKVTKLKAHDEDNKCHIGDTVRIMETGPFSKEKKWMVLEVLEKAARGD
jgi:small subunit ribosomal protein S17